MGAEKTTGFTIRYCDCAGCGCLCLGDSLRTWYRSLPENVKKHLPEPVAGRINSRPFCEDCLLPAFQGKSVASVCNTQTEELEWEEVCSRVNQEEKLRAQIDRLTD